MSAQPVAEVVAAVQSTATEAPPAAKPKKICCACPETRKVRDECVTHNGEDACAVVRDFQLRYAPILDAIELLLLRKYQRPRAVLL